MSRVNMSFVLALCLYFVCSGCEQRRYALTLVRPENAVEIAAEVGVRFRKPIQRRFRVTLIINQPAINNN